MIGEDLQGIPNNLMPFIAQVAIGRRENCPCSGEIILPMTAPGCVMKGEIGDTYNIGGNNEKQNIEVVQTVCDLLDAKVGLLSGDERRRSLIRFVKDRPGHDRRYAIDAGKIRRELGWEPSETFEQGIEQTIDWYLAHRDWVDGVTSGAYREYYLKQYGEWTGNIVIKDATGQKITFVLRNIRAQ